MSQTMQRATPQLEEIAPSFRPAKGRRSRRGMALGIAIVLLGVLTAMIVWRPWAGGTAAPGIAATTNQSRVAVTGTGPGLQWVADQQAEWARNAVTGTGPGLAYLANFQRHGTAPSVTGTGPGLERVGEEDGDEVATIGSP